jgi:hypothetical protein
MAEAFAMGRKTLTQQLTDSILGQHLALAVAAHLARTQLVPDPLNVYDAQHMGDMLDAIANALARVAPLYVRDANGKEPRQLMEAELEGARVKHGATVLALNDGRALSTVSIKRADLRQAIAILKTVGIPELVGVAKRPEPPPQPQSLDRFAHLQTQIAEIERLLTPPFVSNQLERASALMVSIARGATHGRVSNMAMRLMSAVHDARARDAADDDQVRTMLARLHTAVEEAENAGR